MALTHTSNVDEWSDLTGVEVAGRYLIGPPLSQVGTVRTFGATDDWLDREVAIALEVATGESSLIDTGKSVAKISSPHVVNVYACGHFDDMSFVVFERPASSAAFIAREAGGFGWDEVRANAAAKDLVLGLLALQRAGVPTDELHLGSVGIDAGGQVRVSPWPLDDQAVARAEVPGDVALVGSLLEVGTRGDCLAPLLDMQFINELTSLEVSAPRQSTAQIPVLRPAVSPIATVTIVHSSVHRRRSRRSR